MCHYIVADIELASRLTNVLLLMSQNVKVGRLRLVGKGKVTRGEFY